MFKRALQPRSPWPTLLPESWAKLNRRVRSERKFFESENQTAMVIYATTPVTDVPQRAFPDA